MTACLNYIALSGLYLGVFYAFYLLVMRRTTFFTLNRFVLLLGSVICALLPLLRVRTTSAPAAAGPLTITGAGEAAAAGSATGTFSCSGWLTALYVTGMAAVAGYTLVSALILHRRVSGGTRTRIDGFKTVILNDNLPSFTLGKTIFIGRNDLEQHPAIFSHETIHVTRRHYLDLFLFSVIQTLWWWNPLVWIMRTELGLLHEYEADEGVISKGIDATQYQLLLVRKAVGEQRFSLASGFQHAQLKNRIAMMLKHPSNGWMRLSYLALIPLLAVCVYACNPSKQSKAPAENAETVAPETKAEATDPVDATESVPFGDVEQKPTFNGGDANEFAGWVNSQLKYPEAAKQAGEQGRVLVQFTVNNDGSMSDAKILRSASPELDAEALRVVNSCTQKWTPGMQDGKPVPVTFSIPIVFKLK
jgi:TonB family protein